MALSLSQTFWIKINKQKEATNSFLLGLPARFQGKRCSCTVYTAIQYSHYTLKSLSLELWRQKSDCGSKGECFILAQSKEIEISISAMLFICNSNNFSLLNIFESNWLCLQLNISFFPLANDFSSSPLKLKFSIWAVTNRKIPSSCISGVAVDFCLLMQSGQLCSEDLCPFYSSWSELEVWVFRGFAKSSSSVDDGDSEGNPYHTPVFASAPYF